MAYFLTQKAESDILHHYAEGVHEYGLAHTEEYFSELEKIFDFLSDNPEAARERTEINPPVRVHRYKAHIVIYLVKENRDVLILRIRNGREDWISDPM